MTCGAFHRHARLAKPDPGSQSAQIPLMFRNLLQRIDDPTGEQREVARIDREPDSGDQSQHAIEDEVAGAKHPPFLPPHPPHVNDVEALRVFLEQLRNGFRRILQVAIHDDDHIACRVIESRAERRLMAEVTRERDRDDAFIVGQPVLRADANVPSLLPSFTMTISWGPPGSSSTTFEIRRSSSGSTCSSLNKGTATDTRGKALTSVPP